MKINMKALQLIEKGISTKTALKLTESQINTLHNRLISEVQTQTTTSYTITPDELKKGVALPQQPAGKSLALKQTPQGTIKATPNEELGEDVEVSDDPNKETETQDPHEVGPSSDDGFGKETDGMGMMETKRKNNPWSICTAQLGKEFGTKERHLWNSKQKNKYERCVKDVKKTLKEGKNPVSLFLENQIMKIVEKNLPPKITKGDLMKYLKEADSPAVAPKPGVKEPKPGTKTPPKTRPFHPGKNPNPNVRPAPKAKGEKISPELAKEKVLDIIKKILEK